MNELMIDCAMAVSWVFALWQFSYFRVSRATALSRLRLSACENLDNVKKMRILSAICLEQICVQQHIFHRPTRSTLTLWKMCICGGWTKIVKNRWCFQPNANCTFAVRCIFLKSKHNKRTTWTCENSRGHLQTSWWMKVDGRADAADTPRKKS